MTMIHYFSPLPHPIVSLPAEVCSHWLCSATAQRAEAPEGMTILPTDALWSTQTLSKIAQRTDSEFLLLQTGAAGVSLGYRCTERMLLSASDAGADMVYADRWEQGASGLELRPAAELQAGSLGEDFDFGALWLLRTAALRAFLSDESARGLKHAALYALRLYLGRQGRIVHLGEPLYTETRVATDAHAEHFRYLAAAERERQLECEQVCAQHLKQMGAWLPPGLFEALPAEQEAFPVEASVVIPVKNRALTIADAVRSALRQDASFAYNIIVVDNHSTDDTPAIVRRLAAEDSRVVLLTPTRTDLGIGGCWDYAVRSEHCGRYAVQLDSDDLYSGPHTLARIVSAFDECAAAMVVGSYRVVDFELNTLPPGLIQHLEWTDDNGRNNALRVGGVGAPRAFRTALLRRVGFPNISYGEDYAVGLALSRRWRVARIHDELYLCRRWRDNTDAAPSAALVRQRNFAKDQMRTRELAARRQWLQKVMKP